MKKGWKILIVTIVILVLIIWIAKLIIGSQIKPIIEKEASKFLGVPIKIGAIKLGLISGELVVKNFSIDNPDGFSKEKLFSLDAFGLKINYPSLLKKQIVLNQIYLKKPKVLIELLSAKKNNLMAFLEKIPRQKPAKKEEKPLPEFLVKKIIITGGQAKLVDFAFAAGATNTIDNLKFELKNLTNFKNQPENAGQFRLTALLNRKSPLEIAGKINPFEKKISFNIKGDARNIYLTDFTPYYKKAPININSGNAELSLKLDCLKEVLQGLASVKVKNLSVSQKTNIGPTRNLASNLTEYLKDNNGLLAFDFKISGTLKNPKIGFMDALNQLTANILKKTAQKIGEKVAEDAKNKAIREATKDIRIRF